MVAYWMIIQLFRNGEPWAYQYNYVFVPSFGAAVSVATPCLDGNWYSTADIYANGFPNYTPQSWAMPLRSPTVSVACGA